MNEIEEILLLVLQEDFSKAKKNLETLKKDDLQVKLAAPLLDALLKKDYKKCDIEISRNSYSTIKSAEIRNRLFCVFQVIKLVVYKALNDQQGIKNCNLEINEFDSVKEIYDRKFRDLVEGSSKNLQKPRRNSTKLVSEKEEFLKLYQENYEITPNSKWFVVDAEWIKKYLIKINVTSAEEIKSLPFVTLFDPSIREAPGKIVNKSILAEEEKNELDPSNPFKQALKAGIRENIEFVLLPEDCFLYLEKKYKVQEKIQRNAVKSSDNSYFIELHIKRIIVTFMKKSELVEKTHLVSRFEKISEISKNILKFLKEKPKFIDSTHLKVWKMNKDHFSQDDLKEKLKKGKEIFIEDCLSVQLEASVDSSLISETDYLFFDFSKDGQSFFIINSSSKCSICSSSKNSMICQPCKSTFCEKCLKNHKSKKSSCRVLKKRASLNFFGCLCTKPKLEPNSEVMSIKNKANTKVRQESDSLIESQTVSQDMDKKHSIAKVAQELETTCSTLTRSANIISLSPVGLQNLGNTCFMNSALQCLIHCEALSKFLLTSNLSSIINKSNLLGTKGKLVTVYTELLKQLTGGKEKSVAPWSLKNTVGKFAVQFAGYQQQDSHEFLGYLITGLHEDLKEVRKGEYHDIKYKNDSETSDESWEMFERNNKSMIVDLFYGQYKSTLTCPKCKEKSITFDPFNSISLPIPGSSLRIFEVNFVRLDWGEALVRVPCWAPQKATIFEVKNEACQKTGTVLESVKAFEVKNQVPIREASYSEVFAPSRDSTIYFFEVPEEGPICFILISIEKTSEDFPWRILEINAEDSLEVLSSSIKNSLKPVFLSLYGEDSKVSSKITSFSNFFIDCAVCKEKKCDKLCKISPSPKPVSSILGKNKYLYLKVLIPSYTKSSQSSKLKDFKLLKSSGPQQSIQNCFSAFSNPEKLDRDNSWKCPHCKKNVEATKKMEIFKVPQILIIHLKRFKSLGMSREKINSAVSFPREGLDIREFVLGHDPGLYDLFAVSNHFGTLAGGHYTATVFNSLRGKWYDCNDSSVSETDDVSESASYLLFYKAKTSKKVSNSV
jgi:ubiquitin carboxyl-terminal hydrolase 4/11/15